MTQVYKLLTVSLPVIMTAQSLEGVLHGSSRLTAPHRMPSLRQFFSEMVRVLPILISFSCRNLLRPLSTCSFVRNIEFVRSTPITGLARSQASPHRLRLLSSLSRIDGGLAAERSVERAVESAVEIAAGGGHSLMEPNLSLSGTAAFRELLTTDGIIKSPIDERTYRPLTLPNGLRVLLVSDPNSHNAAAAIDVHVGSFSDPSHAQGLAHFCEHMSFLGTEKFPDEDAFSSYLSAHGGSSNAYTDLEDTVFYFDVNSKHLEGALDHFAQFFIAPSFTEEAIFREVNAVDSEHSKNIHNDYLRLYQLEKELFSDPKHPFSLFPTGNKDTLLGNLTSSQLREKLVSFHGQYYSSNLMTLSIISNHTLDELEALCRRYFTDIPNRQAENPSQSHWGKFNPMPINQQEGQEKAAQLLKIVPVDQSRRLVISWPFWIKSPQSRRLFDKVFTTKDKCSSQHFLASFFF